MGPRKPKGYVGKNHEIIGTDILAVLHILKLPAQVLGEAEAKQLAAIKPADWYPIEVLLSLMTKLDAAIGQYGLLRLGRTIFTQSVAPMARGKLHSARDVVDGLDGLYHHTNRGADIGRWRVLGFGPGHAELEKTTPHHCVMEHGILSEAFALVGCPVTILQRQCFREGADSCIYTLTSSVTDERWMGAAGAPAAPDSQPAVSARAPTIVPPVPSRTR